MPIIFGKNIDRKENKIFRVLFVFAFIFVIFFCAKMGTAYAANRYWVGNSGNINDTTHWSATDGGAGGASVPGSSDTVYITAASLGGYLSTITVNVGTTFDSLIISSLDSRLDLILSAGLVINTSATFSGADTNTKRLLVASSNIGVERTITVPSASFTGSNVDFRDIRFTNAVDLSAISGGSGDAGGNSGITFTTAQPQWFKHTSGSATWNDTTKWYQDQAKTIQGRVPLPQDDATFDAGSFTGTSTLNVNVSRMGRSLDMSAVDDAVTMTLANVVENHGSYILGNNVTPNYLYGFKLMGRGSFVLNLFNKPVNFFNSYAHNGTYTNQSNLIFTTTNSMFYIYNGTFDFNDFNVSGPGLMRSAVGTTIYCGNGTFSSTYNSTSSVIGFGGTNYFEGSTFKFEPAGGSSNMSVSGTISYNKLWLSGSSTGNFDFTNSGNSFNELIIDPGRKVRFPANKTQQVEKLTAIGTASEHITITSVTSATHTLNYTGATNVVADYLDLSYSIGTPADKWFASHSTDGGNNSGWTFANAPDAPTGLTPTSGVSEVSLSWTAGTDGGSAITDYVVDYKLTSDSNWATFADPISTLTTLTVTGLTNGLSYDFRVSAVNAVGQGPASATATSTPVNPLDRYWIGGTGNWSDTAHWSNTDGGAGGQTAPTSTNNVYFSAGSLSADGAIITIDTTANMADLNMSGADQTFTFTNTANTFNIYGSLSDSVKRINGFSSTGYLYFKATTSKTITSNGTTASWNKIYFDGVGGEWINQDDWNVGNTEVHLISGNWNTNSKSFTTTQTFYVDGSVSKTLTLGNSIFSVVGWNSGTATNYTFNANTSTVYCGANLYTVNTTFYNIVFTRSDGTPSIIYSTNTYNNFTSQSTGRSFLELRANQTINGTLTLAGNNPTNNRLLVASNTIGTPRTITLGASATFKTNSSSVDFRDITVTGGATGERDLSAITGGSGDAGGNSGITFTTAQPQWFKHTSGAVSWSDSTKWYQDQAKTIQGRVPLPQDDATFDADSFTGTSTLTVNAPRIGRSLDMSAVDDAVIFKLVNNVESYGSFILGDNISIPENYIKSFLGRGNFDLNFYGKSFYGGIVINAPSGIYTNRSDFVNINHIIQLYAGSFYLNNFNVTLVALALYGGNIYLGNGILTLTRDNGWAISGSCNIFDSTGSTIKLLASSNSSNTSIQGILNYNKLWLSGNITGNYDFIYSNTIAELIIDPGRKVRFTAGTTQQIGKLTAVGTVDNPITISSITGATHTLNYTGVGNAIGDYLNLSYSTGTPANKWFASHSTNGGNNSGWTFANLPDAPTDLTPTAGESQTSLSWTAPANNGSAITDYIVDYKLTTEPTTWLTFSDGESALTTAIVTGLTNGASYDFRVSAVNGVGQGTASATASSTPINPLDRYWIGGTGNWSDTLHWSNTDGGTGGQTAPTSTNNVYFSAGSLSADGAVITIDTTANMADLNMSGADQTFTLTNTANSFNIYGSLYDSVKRINGFSSTGYLYFKAITSKTITSNGATASWNRIYFDGVGGEWINQDDWNVGSGAIDINLINGIWNTGTKTITSINGRIQFDAGTKGLDCTSSIINIATVAVNNSANLTFNSNLSTFNIYSQISSSLTYYDVNMLRRDATITGTNTFHNLTKIGTTGIDSLTVTANNTVTGVLTLAGNNATNYRLLLTSNTIGTQRTITVDPANVIASNVDFRDIKFANAIDLSGISGGSGDAGGNSGITFTTAQPQWFKHTSGAVSWSDSTKWYQDQAKTIQGRVPLPQDDATFDADSFTGTSTLSVNVPRIGRSLDMSAVDDSVAMNLSTDPQNHGSFILGNYITPSVGTSKVFYLMGRGNFVLNTYNRPLFGLYFDAPGANYINLSDIITSSSDGIYTTHINSFDFNDYNFTGGRIIINTGTNNFYCGNGIITLNRISATTSFANWIGVGNFYSEGSIIKLEPASGSADLNFSAEGKIYNKIWFSGNHTGNYNITGSNTISELIIDPGRKVRFTAGTTQQIGKLTAIGTADNPITISSITGATHTLNYTGIGNAIGDYLNLSYSTGTPSNKWFASHSTDGGNNSGWTFANAPDAPTAVLSTAGNTQVSLSWSAPGFDGGTAITDYAIDYKLTTEPTTWLTFSDGESTLTTAVVTGLTNGLSYDFRISAVNLIGKGSPSTTSTATPLTVPGAPISATAVRGNAEATVTFSPPLSDGGSAITNYTVTSNPESHTASGLTSPIIVTGLTNGTAYTFTVTATNLAGTGPASDPSNSVTPATIPDAPTTPIATAENGQVSLSWTAPVWNGGSVVTDYVIDYKLSSEATIWLTFVDGTSSETTGIVTGLTNGSSYDFRISAVNDVGQGSPSVETSAMPVTVPNAPTEVSAIPANAQATVSFTPPIFDGGSTINSYKVTSSPGGFTNTGGASPIVVTGLSNGTPYTFTVTAINAIGESLPSVASTPVTPVTVPNAPTEVIATEGNSQASVTFTPPAFDGGTPITLYTATSSPGNFTGTGIDLPIIMTGLTNGNTYTFTVTATNAVGVGPASSPSNQVTLSTEPGPPVNLASTVLGSSIGLSWSEPISNGGNAINDYIIEYQLTTGGVWAIFSDGQNLNTTATVTGLSNGVSYDFRVKAVNNVGPGLPSGTTTATPGEPAQVIIQNFSDLTVSDIGTNIRITNEGSVEYEYQYTWCITDSAENLCGGGNDIFSATAAKLIDHGENWDTTLISNILIPGNYYFHINVFYGSEFSNAYQSFTALATYPNSPTSPVAVAGNANAVVSFDIPTFDGGSPIISYTVTSNPGGLTGSGTSSPIAVQGLTNGNTYTFTVTATNAVGTSPASLASNSVTPLTVPDPPTGLSAEASDGQVALVWTSPINNGGSAITDYVVEYKLTSDLVWVIFSDGTSANTTATVTGLTNNLSYDFRVSAVNIVGQSLVNQTSATLPSVNNGGNSGGSSGSYIRPQIIPEAIIPSEIIPEEIPVNENIYPVEVKPKTDKKPTKNEETSKSNNISSENIDPNTNDNVVSITPVKNPTMKDIPKDILEPAVFPREEPSGLGEVAKMIIKIGGIAMASGGIMYFGFLGIKRFRVKNKLKNQEEKSPIRKI